jgi:DHA1 family bicyclomycin/chloramphenicol resistance-like MFS transporter
MKTMQPLTLVAIGFMLVLGTITTDAYFLIVPDMIKKLGTDISLSYMPMAGYSLGFFFGISLFSPLSDTFGRRPIMIWTSLGLLLTIWLQTLYNNVFYIIGIKTLDGFFFAGVAGMKLLMLKEYYGPKKGTQVLSIMMTIIGVTIMVTPYLSGYFIEHYSWQFLFRFLVMVTLPVWIILWRTLPETVSNPISDIKLINPLAIKIIKPLLKNKLFMLCIFLTGFFELVHIWTVGNWSFHMIKVQHMPADKVGFYQSLAMSGSLLGALYIYRAVEKYSISFCVRGGLFLQCLAGFIGLAMVCFGHVFMIFIALGINACGKKFAQMPTRITCVSLAPQAGIGLALLGISETIFSFIAYILLGVQSLWSYIFMYGLISIILLVCFLLSKDLKMYEVN